MIVILLKVTEYLFDHYIFKKQILFCPFMNDKLTCIFSRKTFALRTQSSQLYHLMPLDR